MINLKNIADKFLIKSKNYESLKKEIEDFIDVESYKVFLTKRKNSKMENEIKNEILQCINSNEFKKITCDQLKENSVVSNNQICSFAYNYDQVGGILKSGSNDNQIFLRIFDGEYEYKFIDKTINVKNEFYKNNDIKCYIKTSSNTQFPFDNISINKDVSGLNGIKKLYIFSKIDKNKYIYKGIYFCKSINDDVVDGRRLFYWILTKNIEDVNHDKIFLSTVQKISSTYECILNKTEIETIVKARVGQSFLRDKILSLRSRCQVTNIENKELLIASHIKPWSKSNDDEKLDVENILLLSPLFDKLFDSGLISFEDNGMIIVSNKISKSDREIIFNDKSLFSKKITMSSKMKGYMQFHRENIFF